MNTITIAGKAAMQHVPGKITVLLMIVLTCGCSAPKKTAGIAVPFQTNDIMVDGNMNEWKQPLTYFDNGTNLQYSFTNNKKVLYICIAVKSEREQIKILRSGMQVYIDAQGKKNELTGVAYPLPHEINPRDLTTTPRATGEPEPDMKQKHKEAEAGMGLPQVFGFNTANNNDVHAKIDWDDNNTMVYELSVPLTTVFGKPFVAQDTLHAISIGFKINSMPSPSNQTRSTTGGGGMSGGRMGGGRMGGGGGRMGGGRMGGGGSTTRSGDADTFFKEQNDWTTLHLSYEKTN
jgi:hypothetical protein